VLFNLFEELGYDDGDVSLTMIKNFDELVHNAETNASAKARQTVLTLVEEAISAVDPRNLIKNRVRVKGQTLQAGDLSFDLSKFQRIVVAGAGKASGAMAEALEEQLGDRIEVGLVNVPKATARNFRTARIRLQEAGHPIPDEGGLEGAGEIAKLLEGLDERTLVIFLLSGGGSALLPLPQKGISLAEKKATTDLLLRCGATIEEINAVRKHISAVKGGRLAASVYPATLLTLILSDIVGDPIASIASGPTVPDPTTYSGAVEVLQRYGVWDNISPPVKECLEEGCEGKRPETPKPGDTRFQRVHNVVLGNNRVALNAADRKAASMGLRPLILSSFIEGEARHVGTVFAGLARETLVEEAQLSKYDAIIAGGETTVTVTGKGRGGRNQELVLSASLRLRGMDGIALASVGTDGIDGLSEYAGAVVDGFTASRANERGLNPLTYLANNDSHNFFSVLGDGILTGPTGTNVNDIVILVKS
jgi:glycerate-2-kinase